ncbi:MAG: hypothetical protein WCK09_16065 [Bacteroidota bacterium]
MKNRVAVLVSLLLFVTYLAAGQSHNYWTRSFNEESSLLSGAVVGGGAGPSAVYYNPASISEVKASKFSLNASLFSLNFINIQNALGENIDLDEVIGKVEPRFVAYMLKPKKYQNWSFEVVFLNNENEEIEFIKSVDERKHVLTGIPGDDRYMAYYQYYSKFRDDWIGIGTSRKIGSRLFLGMSMFATIKTLKYRHALDIQAYPLNDTASIAGAGNTFHAAGYVESNYLKFNDYRLMWKIGVIYKWKSVSIGLTVTTPSVGVYSDGKRVQHMEQQSNITNPETGLPMSDYLINDYEEKGNVKVSFNTPFSVAAGLTYNFRDGRRILYLSMQYYSGIDPYKMVEAEESPLMTSENGGEQFSDWLTYVNGAKPVFDVALGYSWTLSEKLMLKAGFRTDFNYQKNLDFGQLGGNSKIRKTNLDLYYLTCGLSWVIFGQDIITGIEYSFGRSANQTQIANLSDPVEYNFTEQKALQGTRINNATSTYNALILYLGFSLNFGEKKK